MGRTTPEEKRRNRQRIQAAAAAGFRKRGVDAVGIDQLMKAAGMTHGGFYNHFASKEALVADVFEQTFQAALADFDAIAATHAGAPIVAFSKACEAYLSASHRDHPESGCPSAALAADAGRRDVAVQEPFNEGLTGYIERFGALLIGDAATRGEDLEPAGARAQAIIIMSQLVGALVLSRAVALANPELSDEVLVVNRSRLRGVTL